MDVVVVVEKLRRIIDIIIYMKYIINIKMKK